MPVYIRAVFALIVFIAFGATTSAQTAAERCYMDYEKSLARLKPAEPAPRPRPRLMSRREVQDICLKRQEGQIRDKRALRECMREEYASQREAMRPEPALHLLIEGRKGPQLDRVLTEEAEQTYRRCTELLPYETHPNVPCNGRVRQEELEVNGVKRIRTMCFPYAPSIRSKARTWTYENQSAISVAFDGGSDEMRREIQAIAEDWASGTRTPETPNTGLVFDFGRDVDGVFKFNEWSPSDTKFAANIRISFDSRFGHWSMIGNQSDDPEIMRPGEASMNLGGMGNKATAPADWKRIVYHEFGHALGLKHEHQHPDSVCGTALKLEDDEGYVETVDARGVAIEDPEGRRPGARTYLANAPNKWSAAVTDYNLNQFKRNRDFDLTDYDNDSIMKYEFPPQLYRSDAPPECLPTGDLPVTPSPIDRGMINKAYKGLLRRKKL